LKLSENQTIAGWLIKEIKPSHVLLELSGQERVLELITIKPKVKPSADYDPTLKR
jgi:type II secretory pathway component PulC